MEFEEGVRALGFTESRSGRRGVTYTRSPNPFLTYYVQDAGDGTVLFTWEFAIAEYVAGLGLQVGSDEHLNTFLFPRRDVQGPRDPAWVAAQIDLVEETLGAISFVDVEPQGD